MGKIDKSATTSYRTMPNNYRFWLYTETAYTEKELAFREWILKTRATSGLHADCLLTPSSWFSDDHQALVNVHEGSWLYSTAYKPRHILSRDDFHVQPIDGQNLQWGSLFNLMQKTGDYLILRNKDLSDDHLNQPMNFVLLDVNNIIKSLSQNPNIGHVKAQLELLTKYLRSIEKNTSPLVGSDRLFLANVRDEINNIVMPKILTIIEQRVLQERLQELSKSVHQISTDRNRILHFVANPGLVNPHPYEYSMEPPQVLSAYPTQAAKQCVQQHRALSTFETTGDSKPLKLSDCPNFRLITDDPIIHSHYFHAIADLEELEHFQDIISRINGLLSQAGEIYTIQQFRTQLLGLLEQIALFIEDSSLHINALIMANNELYYQAIRMQQELSYWQKWMSNDETVLKQYIANQDSLSRFPSGTLELAKTKSAGLVSIHEVINHLSQSKINEQSPALIEESAQQLDQLLILMDHWIADRYRNKGLPIPNISTPVTRKTNETPSIQPRKEGPLTPRYQPNFFSPVNNTPHVHSFPSLLSHYSMDQLHNRSSYRNPNAIAIGLLFLLPSMLLGLYFLTRLSPKNKKERVIDSEEVCQKSLT